MSNIENPQTILAVDDDELIRDLLSIYLTDLGNVELAASGSEALATVETIKPDLIILDVQMPEIDGYEVCRRLKENEQTSDIPVVFLTANSSQDAEERALENGASDFVRKPISENILKMRASNILELRASRRKLEILASTDPLTGAFNRRHFLETGNAELHRSKRYKHLFTVLMLDIDHFKAVNDTFGHSIGDEALKATVSAIQNALRDEDTLGRLGGEEFAVLLPQTNVQGATLIAERIRASIAEIVIDTPTEPLSFTMSIGISDCTEDDDTVDEALIRADKALYEAKEQGRNRVVCA